MRVTERSAAESGQPVLVRSTSMEAFTNRLLTFFGASRGNAAIVAQHLVESSRMGINSHGVVRIPEYVYEIQSGVLDPSADTKLLLDRGACIAVDGQRAFGQVVGDAMTNHAVMAAKEHGIAFVSGSNMRHTGRLGAYVEPIARVGMLGIAVTGALRMHGAHLVAPFGGKEGRLATNPLAFAFPAGDAPVVADFATSTSSEGSIRWLKYLGREAPSGTLRDADGNPTNDPAVLYQTPRGVIEPLGGPQYGYKGTALSLLAAVMSIVGSHGFEDHGDSTAMAILAIRPVPEFERETKWLADYIRSSPPIEPNRPVLMPGDRERLRIANSRTLEIDVPTWRLISQLGDLARIPLPSPQRRRRQASTTP